jgi:hypothetical protein
MLGMLIALVLAAGCGKAEKPPEVPLGTAAVSNGVQWVQSTVNPNGFMPITVQTGVPVQWIIQVGDHDLTASNASVEIPSLGITKKLKVGDNLIQFTPQTVGVIPFLSGNGALSSEITVVAQPVNFNDKVAHQP